MKSKLIAATIVICLLAILLPASVFAAEASVKINTGDVREENKEVTVPVTISADEQIGTYSVIIEYDTSRLDYISGADEEGEGFVLLSGTAVGEKVSYSLKFRSLSGGRAGLIISSADILSAATGQELPVSSEGGVSIVLSGEDSGSADFETRIEIARYTAKAGISIIGIISFGALKEYYLIDQSEYNPEEGRPDYMEVKEPFSGSEITWFTDKENNVRLLYLMDDTQKVYCYAVGRDGEFYETSKKVDSSNNEFICVPLAACRNVPADISSVEKGSEYIVYGIGKDGSGAYYLSQSGARAVKWEPGMESMLTESLEEENKSPLLNNRLLLLLIAAAAVLIIIIILLIVLLRKRNSSRSHRHQDVFESYEKKKHYEEADDDYYELALPDIPEGEEDFLDDEEMPSEALLGDFSDKPKKRSDRSDHDEL